MSDVKRYQTLARHSMQEAPNGLYVYYADHARIVAEKDAEIQRLREVLEKARKCLTELYPSEPCQAEHANEYYAVNAVINAADAALDPPQRKGTSDEE